MNFGNSDEIKAIQMEYEILGMRINALIRTMKESRRIRKGDAED